MRAHLVKIISSRANPVFKSLLKLTQSRRERRDERMALLDGAHLVAAYMEKFGDPRALIVSAGGADAPEIQKLLAQGASLEPIVLADGLFREVSPVITPSGIMATVDIPAAHPVPPEADCCLLLDGLQDPGNLGSILRSAAAAGASHVLLSKECTDAWSPRVLRAAMGAHFCLNVVERADLAAFARVYKGQVVATVAAGKRSIFDIDLTTPSAFIFGNEGAGVAPGLLAQADLLAGVPMPGGAESINVGAAAAVCLFERVRQLQARGKQ